MDLYPGWMRAYIKWKIDYDAMVRRIAQAHEDNQLRNPEPDDTNAVPISDAEAYRAMDAVSRVSTLREMGIFATTKWRLEARCRFHGEQAMTLDTNEEIPDGTWMRCFGCLSNGNTRWLEISERRRVTDDEITTE